jgi:SAM-dependent methyltransferase
VPISRDSLRRFAPKPVLSCYRRARAVLNRFKYRGDEYHCNICHSNLRAWVYAGPIDHCNLVCPVCNAYGRHRMMGLVIENELMAQDTMIGKRLLHFAPEVGFQNWLKRKLPHIEYKSADLFSPDVDLCIDLESIALPNDSIDVVILSHVLEHVSNDRCALDELNRILRPNGTLFLQVPLSVEQRTIEEKLDTAGERLVVYGKTDHVRLYGSDLFDRLVASGFEVTVHFAKNEPYLPLFNSMALDLPDNSSMLYNNESTTFVCRKRS